MERPHDVPAWVNATRHPKDAKNQGGIACLVDEQVHETVKSHTKLVGHRRRYKGTQLLCSSCLETLQGFRDKDNVIVIIMDLQPCQCQRRQRKQKQACPA